MSQRVPEQTTQNCTKVYDTESTKTESTEQYQSIWLSIPEQKHRTVSEYMTQRVPEQERITVPEYMTQRVPEHMTQNSTRAYGSAYQNRNTEQYQSI